MEKKERRKEYYIKNRDAILKKHSENRVPCPFCIGITYHKSYILTHLENRHKAMLDL